MGNMAIPMLILAILFLIITYQDFRYRAVTIFLFPLIAVIAIYIGLRSVTLSELVTFIALNILFVIFNLAIIYIYISIRFNTHFISFFKKYLGLGDVLLWLAVAPLFSTVNFVWFFLSSLIVALLGFVLLKKFFSVHMRETVPLAGLQSMFYSILLVLICMGWNYNFYNDFHLFGLSSFGSR